MGDLISEFAGEDGRTGMPKFKKAKNLRAGEKLQLGYRTGKEDTDAELDRSAWLGDRPGTNP